MLNMTPLVQRGGKMLQKTRALGGANNMKKNEFK